MASRVEAMAIFRLEAMASTVETMAIRLDAGWRPSLIGWRPWLLGSSSSSRKSSNSTIIAAVS